MNDERSSTTPNRQSSTTPDREHTRESDTGRETDTTGRETDTGHGTGNTGAAKLVSALVAIVGLWIIASPFVYAATDTAVWNNTLVGTGIFLLAGYNFVRLSRDHVANVGVAALALLLGLWIAVSPFVMEMGSGALENSTMVSGLAVVLLSAYNIYANRKADVPERTRTRA